MGTVFSDSHVLGGLDFNSEEFCSIRYSHYIIHFMNLSTVRGIKIRLPIYSLNDIILFMDATARFGSRLKEAREKKRLSQKALSELVDDGLNQSLLSRYESGEAMPRPERVRRLAAVLEVSEAWLRSLYADEEERDGVEPLRQADRLRYSELKDRYAELQRSELEWQRKELESQREVLRLRSELLQRESKILSQFMRWLDDQGVFLAKHQENSQNEFFDQISSPTRLVDRFLEERLQV